MGASGMYDDDDMIVSEDIEADDCYGDNDDDLPIPWPEELKEFHPTQPVTNEELIAYETEGVEPYPGYGEELLNWQDENDKFQELVLKIQHKIEQESPSKKPISAKRRKGRVRTTQPHDGPVFPSIRFTHLPDGTPAAIVEVVDRNCSHFGEVYLFVESTPGNGYEMRGLLGKKSEPTSSLKGSFKTDFDQEGWNKTHLRG